MRYKHIFGPVQSRRLGISLGVDVIPSKYCPLNCIYCEIHTEPTLTDQRSDFYPIDDIISEIDAILKNHPKLDFVTFSGSGEPTLYKSIGKVVDFIKSTYPEYKIAMITNSVLLSDIKVRDEIKDCDIILPSLDAISQNVFEMINRPLSGITSEVIVNGLKEFRKVCRNQIWLEVFIVPGINDLEDELIKLRTAIELIDPDRVQINSLDRPGTEPWVDPAGTILLQHIQHLFSEKLACPVDILAQFHYHEELNIIDEEDTKLVIQALKQRSQTINDLSETLNIHINEVNKILRQLANENRVEAERKDRQVLIRWKN